MPIVVYMFKCLSIIISVKQRRHCLPNFVTIIIIATILLKRHVSFSRTINIRKSHSTHYEVRAATDEWNICVKVTS